MLPLREDAVCQPVSPYGVTKLAGEHLCGLYAKAHGLHTVALRFFTVFGPRQRPDMAFNRFMRALLRDDPIDVYGSGQQTRDFTFVGDIVDGAARARHAPSGSVINVRGGHRVTLLEAIERARAEVAGRTPRLQMTSSERGDARDTWADLQPRAGAPGLRTAARRAASDGLAAAAGVDQYAPRRLSTAGTVCSSSLMSQLRLQPVTYM